ncbi:MAG: penicillin amidase [Chloroflexi bacterium]|jgi:penicillin amidase|nr:MAG: penicillin amidase [Chloroflexota bacterium]
MSTIQITQSDLQASLPDMTSDIQTGHIKNEISITRDIHGIPHVTGSNSYDAFFGQGFATAQDRLWHMECDRRKAFGRWAELVGEPGLESDITMRKFQIEDSVIDDLAHLNSETILMLTGYSDGVNGFINSTSSLPVEYKLTNAKPEPWSPKDCLAVYKVRHIMMGVFEAKYWRAQLLNHLGPERTADLLKGYQPGHLLITPPLDSYAGSDLQGLESLQASIESIRWMQEDPEAGSNSWALHGNKTISGKPLLAGDPHRGLDTPNCYYQNQVTCPDFDVVGLSFPGCPGFPHFGHNEKVAWCVTHAMADYQDLYVEKIKSNSVGATYKWKGDTLEVEWKEESIKVAGLPDHQITLKATKHGPIISENPSGTRGIAFKYTSTTDTNHGFEALLPQMTADSVSGAEQAMEKWVDPCNNYMFVDVHGDIQYLNRGQIPIRGIENAWLPVPGWTGKHEWQGNIPFEKMPRSTNPKNGFIVTANNKIIGEQFPYYMALDYAPEFRARRILQRIEALEKATVEDMISIHSERTSIPASVYVPHILELDNLDLLESKAQDLLNNWTYQMDPDSAAATIYSTFRWKLHVRVIGSLLGSLADQALVSGGRGAPTHVNHLAIRLMEGLKNQDASLLPDEETWPTAISKAFSEAIKYLEETIGDQAENWEWGKLHFTNPTHTLADIYVSYKDLLNPPSVSMGGDGDTPQAGSFAMSKPFVMTGMSVARYVFDPSDWDNSRWIVPLGSSGHPGSPHYADQTEKWSKIEVIKMAYSSQAVQEITVTEQHLIPVMK